jgi:hypothetical protein
MVRLLKKAEGSSVLLRFDKRPARDHFHQIQTPQERPPVFPSDRRVIKNKPGLLAGWL